jgi:hypothetical protein
VDKPAALSWNIQNAAVAIDGIGSSESTDSRTIPPDESTTYHLSAKVSGDTTVATAHIDVNMKLSKKAGLKDWNCDETIQAGQFPVIEWKA